MASASTPAVSLLPNLANDPLFDRSTYDKLQDIHVDVSWNNADLRTVLRDLTLLTDREDFTHSDISFRFEPSVGEADRQRKITLRLPDARAMEVLEYLVQSASLTVLIHRDLVLVVPRPVAVSAPVDTVP